MSPLGFASSSSSSPPETSLISAVRGGSYVTSKSVREIYSCQVHCHRGFSDPPPTARAVVHYVKLLLNGGQLSEKTIIQQSTSELDVPHGRAVFVLRLNNLNTPLHPGGGAPPMRNTRSTLLQPKNHSTRCHSTPASISTSAPDSPSSFVQEGGA